MPATLGGGFAGVLAGLILINPIIATIGGITGAAVGAVLSALKEVGIEEDFMKDLSMGLRPGSSALFVVAHKDRPEKIIEALRPYKGKILRSPTFFILADIRPARTARRPMKEFLQTN